MLEKHFKENKDAMVKKIQWRNCSLEDAEDIVQNAYYFALLYWKSYDGRPLDAWFSRILNNELRKFKNLQRGGECIVPFDSEESVEGYNDVLYTKETIEEIKDRINKQSEPLREVLWLHFIHQYPPRDIARITDINGGNIRIMIHRFKNELQERYK